MSYPPFPNFPLTLGHVLRIFFTSHSPPKYGKQIVLIFLQLFWFLRRTDRKQQTRIRVREDERTYLKPKGENVGNIFEICENWEFLTRTPTTCKLLNGH